MRRELFDMVKRRADGRYEPVRQGYVEQGEEQQDDVTVKAYAAEDDAGHFFCVHAGSAADSGGYGVVAAHGHDGVADIAEADEDEDGRGKEALDEGHGEHADIITGDVDHDEAAAVPVSAACEPAETQTEKIEQTIPSRLARYPIRMKTRSESILRNMSMQNFVLPWRVVRQGWNSAFPLEF